ncbi:DNA gyrase subunit A [Candidatus Dojkabacteria bacterium]|uniref:DNA topoisomerase (ATP-hydrolyzing) n=1 Tax=Candidatus Dojkabacteria bacterium TaxID=2099670 RepID=A0A3M0Z0D1_9BACT|nr:MAG: DNA gyrase subunit A [Candidatus Dojkabacteria bacterium]
MEELDSYVGTNKGIVEQDIVDELEKSYIDYAMSVIISRALPDLRDGLKPVQRRILYSMYKMNVLPGSPHKKVARIVGDVIGKYHPHGDSSVTDALVRMGQDFNLRYPLIDGQGNFGSIDGDPAAAMRYIEARISKIGLLLLENIEHTVDFVSNYDGNELEPKLLSASFPNILLNGAEGIAVGMATKIPPHNLREVSNAIISTIRKGRSYRDENILTIDYKTSLKKIDDIQTLPKNRFPKFISDITTEELIQDIKGPDFPTGGEIYGIDSIKQFIETGRGSILIKGISHIEESQNGRMRIVITEIPYQVNKSSLIAKIVSLVKEKKIEGISDIRDESNKDGIRVVIELKRECSPKIILNQLYTLTELQKNFSCNMVLLHDNRPRTLGVKQVLELFIQFRTEIIIKLKEFELAKSREREHILEGLRIAIDHIDEIIKLIKSSKDSEEAKTKLCTEYSLTEIQAQAILDMQLRRLAALEINKINAEYDELQKKIHTILDILSSDSKILDLIIKEQEDISARFGDERRTKVFPYLPDQISIEDTIPNKPTIITMTQKGYIKRIDIDTNRTQYRGGSGKKIATTREDDSVRHVVSCMTHDEILFFSNRGKVYSLKAYKIPESSSSSKGLPLVNYVNLSENEYITGILTRNSKGEFSQSSTSENEIIEKYDDESPEALTEVDEVDKKNYKYLLMATLKGFVKKTNLKEFTNIRTNGITAIKLSDDDELVWIKPTSGNQTVLLTTKLAKSIHFREEDIRQTGRASIGVKGIKLKPNDSVISVDTVSPTKKLFLTITENGFGKLTNIENYPTQRRGGSGVFTSKINSKTGNLVAAMLIDGNVDKKELMIVSRCGQAIRIEVGNIPINASRLTLGVILMRLKEGDKVSAVTLI